jgi:hypothetical protein
MAISEQRREKESTLLLGHERLPRGTHFPSQSHRYWMKFVFDLIFALNARPDRHESIASDLHRQTYRNHQSFYQDLHRKLTSWSFENSPDSVSALRERELILERHQGWSEWMTVERLWRTMIPSWSRIATVHFRYCSVSRWRPRESGTDQVPPAYTVFSEKFHEHCRWTWYSLL